MVRKVLAPSHGSAGVEGKLGLVGPLPHRRLDGAGMSSGSGAGALLIVPCPPGFSPSQGIQWFLSPKLVFKNASWPAETPGGVCPGVFWLCPGAQACRGFGRHASPGLIKERFLEVLGVKMKSLVHVWMPPCGLGSTSVLFIL